MKLGKSRPCPYVSKEHAPHVRALYIPLRKITYEVGEKGLAGQWLHDLNEGVGMLLSEARDCVSWFWTTIKFLNAHIR